MVPILDLSSAPPLPRDVAWVADTIHIIYSPTQVTTERLAYYQSLLNSEELARTERLKIPAKRHDAVVARGFMRDMLGIFLRYPPRDFVFQTNPHGKPYLSGLGVEFNLSHTRGGILLAVAKGVAVGVDIEERRENISHLEIAQRFYTPTEYEAMAGLRGEAEQLEMFFKYWTRKEAIFKAAGRGIAYGLDAFEIPTDVKYGWEGPHVILPALDLGEWYLCDLPGTRECAAAVAYGGVESKQLKFWSPPMRN